MQPKIGLALGGGGARGFAHVGILKVFERENIPIDYIAGTSMGGLIGSLYAIGMSAAEIEEISLDFKKKRVFGMMFDPTWSTRGFIKGSRIYNYLAKYLGMTTFSETKIPLAMMATDIVSGQEIVLQQGRLVDAVRATISVPIAFAPVKMGQAKLVDGGVLDNVPADLARALGADIVVAVDVWPVFSQERNQQVSEYRLFTLPGVPDSFMEMWRVVLISIGKMSELRLKIDKPDVLIKPKIPVYIDVLIGFDHAAEAIAAGEAAAEAALPQIRALLNKEEK
jgi:NTE family protein